MKRVAKASDGMALDDGGRSDKSKIAQHQLSRPEPSALMVVLLWVWLLIKAIIGEASPGAVSDRKGALDSVSHGTAIVSSG
jgi:hypothetical protein